MISVGKKMISAALIAGIIILAVGLGLIGIIAYDIYGGASSKSWPSVIGTVQSSKVHQVTKKKKHRRYEAIIRYAYTIEGKSYSSSRVNFGTSRGYLSRYEVDAIVSKYPRGSDVKVFYKPDDPEKAVLETIIQFNVLALLSSPFIVLLGFYLLRTGYKELRDVS